MILFWKKNDNNESKNVNSNVKWFTVKINDNNWFRKYVKKLKKIKFQKNCNIKKQTYKKTEFRKKREK